MLNSYIYILYLFFNNLLKKTKNKLREFSSHGWSGYIINISKKFLEKNSLSLFLVFFSRNYNYFTHILLYYIVNKSKYIY